MSFWSHNVELLDEQTVKFLPEPWKERVESGELELSDVPENIRDKAMEQGITDYWSSRIDAAMDRAKEERALAALAGKGEKDDGKSD